MVQFAGPIPAALLGILGFSFSLWMAHQYFLTKHSYSEAQIEYAQVLVKMGERDAGRNALEELLADIECSPRYTRSRERRWARAAKRELRLLDQVAA